MFIMMSVMWASSSFLSKGHISMQRTTKKKTLSNICMSASQNGKGLERVVKQATTWCGINGLMYTDGNLTWSHAPVTLIPNTFPKSAFSFAQDISPIFNTLVDKISRDRDFLVSNLAQVSETDDFVARLLDIYESMPEEILRSSINLGIHRSDYMLQENKQNHDDYLLQIELNTIASSFGCLSQKVGELHRYILNHGSNDAIIQNILHETCNKNTINSDTAATMIPENNSIRVIAFSLAMAHFLFGDNTAVILFIVQPGERNMADQRLLESELWTLHGIRVVFMTLAEIANTASLSDDDSADLQICPDSTSVATGVGDGGGGGGGNEAVWKVSVAYFRAGYAPTDYPTEREWEARTLIEMSSAVKCPSVGYQLAGTKKIQQVLTEPGQVERFLGEGQDSALLRQVFAEQYSLGPMSSLSSPGAVKAMENAIKDGSRWVLKPQREGGGNNYYGHALSDFLSANKEDSVLKGYVLMQRIFPRIQRSLFLRQGRSSWQPSISELGIYSVFLGTGTGDGSGSDSEPLLNEYAGYLVRTKAEGVDEGGVATGFSVLNSIILAD
eukprot:gene1976-3842_t